MKIASKIRNVFLATSLIITGIAMTAFYLIEKDVLQKSIYDNLTTVLASRTAHIETYLKMLEISVGQLSKSPTLENFLKISDKESPQQSGAFEVVMRRLKRTQEANPAITEFLLMDKAGKVTASSDKSNIGMDESAEPIFLEARKAVFIKGAHYFQNKVSFPVL